MADRKREVKEGCARCEVCGAEIPETVEEMTWHIVTCHPMETVQSKAFIRSASRIAFNLGSKLASALKGES